MQSEIKDIIYPVIPGFDPTKWRPDNPKQVYIPLELSIGEIGKEGTDLFQLVVATPEAIQGRPERRRDKLLVVQTYDWQEVRATLEQWVTECEKPSWEATVNCLRRRFEWEFDGMARPK